MALVTQDDTGLVPNANGYISVAYFKSYFADRNIEIDDFDDTQIEGAIVSATDYIDTRWGDFKGTLLDDTQTTKFPRGYLYGPYGKLIEGLPVNLKKATAEYARQYLLGGSLLPVLGEAQVTMKREKVGPIEEETQYATATSYGYFKPYAMADSLLAGYLQGNFLRVYRAWDLIVQSL